MPLVKLRYVLLFLLLYGRPLVNEIAVVVCVSVPFRRCFVVDKRKKFKSPCALAVGSLNKFNGTVAQNLTISEIWRTHARHLVCFFYDTVYDYCRYRAYRAWSEHGPRNIRATSVVGFPVLENSGTTAHHP